MINHFTIIMKLGLSFFYKKQKDECLRLIYFVTY